ncbi:MAG: site-specific integrase [Methanomicrobia archaeon]|nr:site-specific integrase [Methanomicrobia archaeon]
MSEKIPILKGKKIKTRILRPSEFEQLRLGAKRTENRTLLDACLLLGARYTECQKIQANARWFDGNFVHLPSEAQRKVKRKQAERWIRLSSMGKTILPYFFENRKRLPSIQAWDYALVQWAEQGGLNPVGISSRTMRKTYESWLIFYFPEATNLVYLSQGHTTLTSLQHYINLPFIDEDKKSMGKWVEGWL